MSSDIVVVGSLNEDLTIRVPRLPTPGETVLGSEHFVGSGGKGANQAAAAAKLGRTVAMVGRVGADAAGRDLRGRLEKTGVDVSAVAVDPDAATGVAVITLDEAAENAIVVSPGANRNLSVTDVEAASAALAAAAVTLVQLEIPLVAVERAVALAGGIVVLNPAPARQLSAALLERVDVLVPNRSELALLAGSAEAESADDAANQAERVRGPGTVVVTLGAAGALLVTSDGIVEVPAPAISAVDPTAAGDAFCGALADALARGEEMRAAVRWAVHAGAAAATRPGALASLPTADEIRSLMKEHDR